MNRLRSADDCPMESSDKARPTASAYLVAVPTTALLVALAAALGALSAWLALAIGLAAPVGGGLATYAFARHQGLNSAASNRAASISTLVLLLVIVAILALLAYAFAGRSR